MVDELYDKIFGELDKPKEEKDFKQVSPYDDIFSEIFKVEVGDSDFFNENSYCYIGTINRFQWNVQDYANPFDDPEFDYYNSSDWIGWSVNYKFMCLGMIAQAGSGKCQHPFSLLNLSDGRILTCEDYYNKKETTPIASYNIESNKIEYISPLIEKQPAINRKMYKITTDGGFEVEVTDGHRMITIYDNGRFDEIMSDNITDEHYLCIYEPKTEFKEKPYYFDIDYSNCFLQRRKEVYKLMNLGIKRLSIKEKTGFNKSFVNNIWYDTNKNNHKLEKYDETYYSSNINSFSKKIEYVTDDLLLLIAMLITDGGLTDKYSINFTKKNLNIRELYKKNINNLFGKQNYNEKSDYTITFSNATVKHILNKIGLINSLSYDKTVPEWIFELSNRQKALFLKAFISCDGHITKKNGNIELMMANKHLVSQIGILFNNIGISCVYPEKKTPSKFGMGYKLCITSERSKKIFLEQVGSLDDRNINRMVFTGKEGNSIDSKTHYPRNLINWNNLTRNLRENVRNYIVRNRNYIMYTTLEQYSKYEKVIDYPFKILKVKKVEVRDYSEHTYDIEVPKNHNLFSGTKGLILNHNTTVSKNILGQYHKLGYKILIISSKDDEFSMSKNNKGTRNRLHPYNRPETLPVKSFVPNYVRKYVEEEKPPYYTTYKYYSHSIKDFRTPEIWMALGLTKVVADRICSLIGEGITSLKEIKNRLWASNLAQASKLPAMPKLDNLIGTNFLNSKVDSLPLYEEWEKDNIVAINYFSNSGFYMSTDISRIVDMVRDIGSKYKKQGRQQRMIIMFDDMQMYADPTEKENEYAIKSIKYCLYNGRSKGIDLILSFQDPDLVDKKILRGIQIFLISHFADPSVLNGILDPETIRVMKAGEEQKGTIYDVESFTKEWILKLEGKKWYRLIPEGCHYYHK